MLRVLESKKEADAGIPVVTWDAGAPKSKRIAFYGVDDVAAGRIMGEQASNKNGPFGRNSTRPV
jgi:ABC-type sugar transport system substrate-binding protein